jgi:uncharacterized protein (TIGR02444 family)
MCADRSADGSFWNFSLGFYALPEVAEAFLELQDRCGADVNVLLFLLYRADAGRLLSAADVERIDALAAPWRESVVVPLRSVRRALKAAVGEFHPADTAALRTEVKRIELAAERLQQEKLESMAAAMPGAACDDAAACARIHLKCYARHVGGLEPGPAARILERFGADAAARHRA